MTNYNDGSWHGWNGGECPVHPRSVVEIVYFDGGVLHSNEAIVSHCEWGEDCSFPIIAFRVVKEHKEPREFWLFRDAEDGVWKTCISRETAKCFSKGGEIIHVREVL